MINSITRIEDTELATEKTWLYINFVNRNIFINMYVELEGKKHPIFFNSLSTFIEQTSVDSKRDPERVDQFAEFVAEWLIGWEPKELYVVFRGIGVVLNIQALDPFEEIDHKRVIFIDALEFHNINVKSIIDTSPIPYNGCKVSRRSTRRGRGDHKNKQK